jgi:hypothetical protein
MRRERANDLMEGGEVIKYVCFWSNIRKNMIPLSKELCFSF